MDQVARALTGETETGRPMTMNVALNFYGTGCLPILKDDDTITVEEISLVSVVQDAEDTTMQVAWTKSGLKPTTKQ